MNKSELISAVALTTGLQKKDVALTVDAAFEAITAALAQGHKVSISGFGTFEAKERQARVGCNPKTGESVTIPAKTAPTFKPSQHLKEKVEK